MSTRNPEHPGRFDNNLHVVICHPMSDLTSSQRRFLRSRAHSLKPIVQIGQQGLSDAALAEIDRALDRHELIKIKFGDFKDQKEDLCDEIEAKLSSQRVGLIGHTLVLYRQNLDPQERQIKLPN